VELQECRSFVPGLSRVHAEQQQFSRLKPTSIACRLGQRAHEQAGRHQQQQRNRDLRDHQDTAYSDAEQASPRRTQPLYECWREIHPGRLDRGSQAEQHARRDGAERR
jgi:hypothetical protein